MSQVLEHQIPILEQLAKDRDKGKTLVVIPSGAGKTWIAAFDSKAVNAKNILYIAHRREILRQAAKIFQQVHENRGAVGFLDRDNKDFHRRILFATNATLANKENLDIISKTDWDYVVVDEFHHVAAESYTKILERIKTKFLLGLTATPYRLDKKDIMEFVDNNQSYNIDLEIGIKKGILVPFHYNGLHDDIDYSDIQWQGNKYRESDLNKKLLIDKRDNQIVDEFLRLIGKGHSTISFCVNIQHTQRMVDKFTERGISCRRITHKTATAERDNNVRDFTDRKFDVLFVRDVFNEGVDFPKVEAILLLRPTWSKNVFFQQIGRGLRKSEGKTHLTILDFIGNYNHAFDKGEWLKFAEKSEAEMEHKPIKPLYNYDVPYVHFQQKLLDIFEIQKQFGRIIPLEELKEEYFRMKQLLKRFPLSSDFQYSSVAKIRLNKFTQSCGSWSRFLEQIGETEARRDALKTEYFRIKDTLKHIPTSEEFMQNTSHLNFYAFYSNWRDFLKELGEDRLSNAKEQYKKLKSELGYIPTGTEFTRFLKTHKTGIKTSPTKLGEFGGYINFLIQIGEVPEGTTRKTLFQYFSRSHSLVCPICKKSFVQQSQHKIYDHPCQKCRRKIKTEQERQRSKK